MRHPAAFINAIADARNFKEAIEHLQLTWNELCEARNTALEEAAKLCDARADAEGAPGQDTQVADYELRACASAIRALKSLPPHA